MKKNLLRSALLALMVLVGGNAWAQATWEFANNTAVWGADGVTLNGGAQYDESATSVATGGVTFTGTSGFVATARGIGFYAVGSTTDENISIVVPAGYKATVSAYTSGNRTVVGSFGETTQTFNAGWASSTKDFSNAEGTEPVTLYLYCGQNAGGADQTKAPFLEKIVLTDMSSVKSFAWSANAVATINGAKTTIKTYNSEGEIDEGSQYTITVDKVIKFGEKYYGLKDNQFAENVFGKTFTMGGTAPSYEFTYEEIEDVAFYGEVEDIFTEGVKANKQEGISVLSNGGGYTGQGTEGYVKLTFTVPARGIYKLTLGMNNTNDKSRGFNFAIDDADVSETITVNASSAFVQEIADQTLEAGEHTITLNITYSLTPIFDYLLIVKTASLFDPSTAIVNAAFNPAADPLGWTEVVSGSFNDKGMGLIGQWQVRSEFPAATVDETHLDTEYAAGLEARWSTNYASYTQDVTLPAGSYALSFDVENTNEGTVKANYDNLFFVKVGETTYTDESKEWMDGKSVWTTHTIKFSVAEEGTATISLGYGTGSNNLPHTQTPALFVSHMSLALVPGIEVSLAELQAAIAAAEAKLKSYTLGDVVFTYPAEEFIGPGLMIGFAQAAYEKAESVEAVEKATKDLNDYIASFDPIMQIPSKEKAYYIANKTAEGNLCIGNEAVTIAKDAAVFFTEVEGGFVLSNEEGNYILKTATNNWTFSTTANKDEAYVVNFNLVDGAYTIQGANGLFGTDNTTEGSTVYANKTQANNGLWTVTIVPKFDPAYGTLWTSTDGSSMTEDTEPYNYIVLENKYFKDFAKVGDSIKVAISSVDEGATLELNIANDGQSVDIQHGTTSHVFTLDADEIEKIQNGADVIVKWKKLIADQVELTEFVKEQIIDNGTYYLAAFELEDNNLMAAGKNWGTHGIVNNEGLDLNITYNEGAKNYYFETNIYNSANEHFLGSNLFMDASAFGWSIEEGTYGFNIYAMFDGVKKYISVDEGLLTLSETPYAWVFIHSSNWNSIMKGEYDKALDSATAENGVDVTFLLKDANFNRNDHRWEAWTVSEDCINKNLGGGCNETNGNGCAESYHSTFTISQVAKGAPKGIYALTVQGFYRQDSEGEFALPYFFANDEKADIPVRTGTENSMTEAGISFSNGLYTIDPIYVEVAEDGTLTVGVTSETANFWCIWDNFKLTYYGATATMDEVKNGALVKELADLRTEAQSKLAEVEPDAVKRAINEALTTTADVTGADAINTAVATMKAVIEKAEASVIAKDVLPKMKELVDATNVYTAEAQNTYYTQWEVKYLDGSLTKTEATSLQDPFLVTGWHANITVDNFLLSAWDTNPDFQNAPYYINSWSVEGENDGSEFKVPFFEYWTGDDASLGEKTLTATMNNLEAGDYEVTAWVRVRAKNGYTAPAYGITFQANDGENVNAADGTQVGESQFYLKEVSATGIVAEDGVLKIKFNVAADNNISWLSFKNVKFEKQAAEPQTIEGTYFTADVTATEKTSFNPGTTEITSELGAITGGKMYAISEQEAAKDLIGKQSSYFMFCMTNNNTYFKVELDNPIAVGDEISAMTYSRTDTDLGLWLSTAASRPGSCTTALNIATQEEQAYEPFVTYTVQEGDELVGATTFYIYRATGKSTYFSEFKITRPGGEPGPEEPEAPKYEGYVAIATLIQGQIQGTVTTAPQTVTIAKTDNENVAAITFSGFSATTPPTTFPEFTFNANVSGEDAVTYAVAEDSKIVFSNTGGMTMTYNLTGEGTQASAESAPAIALQIYQNPMMVIHVAFAATEEQAKQLFETTGISSVKTAGNDGSIYTLSGQKVEKTQKGLYIINGKKVVVK